MTYRDDLTALAARHHALTAEVEQKQRELDDNTRMLDEARARARLPILDNIRVASPCPAAWDAMVGDDRVRHCAQCNKNVYNLTNMTRAEAEMLIAGRNGELCVRYYQRSDGTIITSDCTIGVKRKRRRRIIAAGIALVASATAAFVIAKRMREQEQEVYDREHMVQGGAMYVLPPARPTPAPPA
jgi:NCAIR mutase (PurE)-related protein